MDRKERIHNIADRIAQEKFDCGVDELPDEKLHPVWEQAEQEYYEGLQDQADRIREELELQRLEEGA